MNLAKRRRASSRLGFSLGVAILGACQTDAQRYVSAYSGPYTDDSLPEEFALFRPLSFEDATLAAVSLSEVIHQPSESVRFEAEVNAVHWFGDQSHQELNGLFLARWLRFPWDSVLDTSFAFGNGLSWATEVPKLEDFFHPDTGGAQLLYHIAVEFEFALPKTEQPSTRNRWSTFVRVHHRSGVFGLFSGVDGGSNVLALGLRYAL